MQLGAASAVTDCLQGSSEPEALVIRAAALCSLGHWDVAIASCETLLRHFAIDAVEGLSDLATRLCHDCPGRLPGWVGVDRNLRMVGRVSKGRQPVLRCGGGTWNPVFSASDELGLDEWSFELPHGFSGTMSGVSGDRELLGSNFKWPPDFGFSGWVVLDNDKVKGEVQFDWAPNLPAKISLGCGGNEYLRLDVSPSQSDISLPFSVDVSELEPRDFPIDVSAILPDGTSSPLIGSPVLLAPEATVPTMSSGHALTSKLALRLDERTDIVIPVYSGRNETLACIERVLATTTRRDAEIVVVNDASPDPELCAALARLKDDGLITLITNETNLGFPGAANVGMDLHPDRDVVLLNADTETFGDWVLRLKSAAYSMSDVGTVTPLGEYAAIASYPAQTARSITTERAKEIDAIAREVNAGKLVELPVGVGFCLYIKRACIHEIGRFNQTAFDRGYGEENDFCLRARAKGWKHLAATDVFVHHLGGKSFGAGKKALMRRNRHVLNARHPGYDAMISEFIAADPLADARRAIDTQRLMKAADNPVLLVTFALPGGVKRHVEERKSALTSVGHTVIALHPQSSTSEDTVVLKLHGGELDNLVFKLPDELPLLRALLEALRFTRIELHHFAGLPASALEMTANLGVPYDVYIHDYSWICPRLSLVGENGGYCGEPPVQECEACIQKLGTALDKILTVEALRARSARILGSASRVIVPSRDVATRMARYFPTRSTEVIGWENSIVTSGAIGTTPIGRVHVVVIGAISIPKGYDVVLACARDAAARGLNLDFVVIGYTHDDDELLKTERVFITGPYQDSEVAGLLDREGPHIAFFPSVVPETWSYALTHALSRGMPILAFDLGAIAERLRTYEVAELLPSSTAAPAINDALLRFVRRMNTSNGESKELAMATTETDSPTSSSELLSGELQTSVQVLNLPVGTYAFTVKGTQASTSREQLAIPALQIGLAPLKSLGTAEFLSGATTLDRWLATGSDVVVVRISGGNTSLLLTSLRLPDSPVLAIDVRKIDAQTVLNQAEQQATAPADQSGFLATRIVTHIRNIGDIQFNEGWAGCLGDKLWIEGFAILSLGNLAPDAIEYSAVTADGFQTPWASRQAFCGTRGQGSPIIGYAVRLTPETASQYDCTYSGKFVSGNTRGPFRAGELCRSDVAGDPLWGIELQVVARSGAHVEKPAAEVACSSDAA